MFPQRTFIRISRKYLGTLFLTLLTALGLSACASLFQPEPTSTPTATFTPVPPTATPEPLALTVNGEGISYTEFDAAVKSYTSAQETLGKTVSETDATDAVIQDLTAQLLLAQGAHANGFMLDDAGLQSRIDALAAQIGGADKLSKWESDHGYSEPTFRTALRRDAEAAWMRDKIIAEVPSTTLQVHVQQILLYNEETAESFLIQLNGGTDFDGLAERADPLTRGDLGWIPQGYLLEPKIEEAAFSLGVGDHSVVIPTSVGFHIIRVLERDPNRPLSPDALLTLQERALKNWMEQQRQQATIVLAPT